MNNFRDIIDAFPSKQILADLLGTNPTHIRTMRSRDWIPPQYWDAIIDYASLTTDEQFDVLGDYSLFGELTARKKHAA